MIEDYRKACKRGRHEVSDAVSHGRYPYLPVLDDILGDTRGSGEVPVGVREIPMELVVGTKTRARANTFSCGFMPIADEDSEFAAKWSRLFDAQVSEGIRDPVVVYEYLQRFYVQEGNKRVSVLRSLDVPTITASITRVMPAPSDDPAIRCYHEFVRLYQVAPVYGLRFSQEGSCEQLAKLLGQTLDEPWPEDMVRRLTSTLYQFTRSYRARGGALLSQTVADAFLLYVKAYATTGPLGVSAREMDRRVARLWGELVVAAQDEAIAYLEQPSEQKGRIISKVKSVSRTLRAPKPLHMAFVYDRDPSTSGWTAQHERGRLSLQERLGKAVATSAAFGKATDDDFDRAVASAVAEGADVVVTASPRQMEQTRRAAMTYPACTFINCSVNLSSSAVRTFYARMYEVKFLMGALAAGMAENHRVGYLAISPIFGSVAEVNAFAIGAAMVDPYCTVHLKWSSAEGFDWRRELEEDDVHVLAGRDYPNPADPSEPWGLCCLHRNAAPERVATPVWDWGRYYELIVRSLQDDRWRKEGAAHRDRALNYWWGMSAGVVRLELGEGIATGQRRLVQLLEREVTEGRVHPFEGLLMAQRGEVVRNEGSQRLANEEIASMRWLNENVVGRLPKSWELSEAAAGDVATSGVISAETDAEDE
jgi:basic membrane lipoprotein Med (substrate-binding protein (PBP1-ABC) superfamily)